MIYGVITSRAHLDRLDPAARADGEIAWDLLPGFVPGGGVPQFAGRYFLGVLTQAEADGIPGPGAGFCLWAHGEGADSDVPRRIVPLQRSDRDRQAAVGGAGEHYGAEDAAAHAQYIDHCLAVGDIELPTKGSVFVFLEVDDGTNLSFEYWSAWATAMYEAILYPARFQNRANTPGVQPLLPAIRCGFEFDSASNSFLPNLKVRECLSVISRSYRRTRCHGFWARRLVGVADPIGHPFGWNTMGTFEQLSRILVPPLQPLKYPVPVRFLQWFDGPDGQQTPAGVLRDTLVLLTLSEAAVGTFDPLPSTLVANVWHADRTDAAGNLVEMPVQFGIDKNRKLTAKANCLRGKNISISCLPSSSAELMGPFGGTLPTTPQTGPCTLAFRYYSSSNSKNAKDMTPEEVNVLSVGGLWIVATWQTSFSTTATIDDLIDDFLTADRGKTNALAAFDCAAFLIGQPAYTPLYFAIDFPPGQTYIAGRLMPPMDDVKTYFKNVNQGYREYIKKPGAVPYYIGVYGARYVCEALYRCGLATHFWQPWPPNWGQFAPEARDNWRPFRHANAWQIVIDTTVPEPGLPDVQDENSDVNMCVPPLPPLPPGQPETRVNKFDINVSWGDPGSFQVFP